jgi:hypothetical protein
MYRALRYAAQQAMKLGKQPQGGRQSSDNLPSRTSRDFCSVLIEVFFTLFVRAPLINLMEHDKAIFYYCFSVMMSSNAGKYPPLSWLDFYGPTPISAALPTSSSSTPKGGWTCVPLMSRRDCWQLSHIPDYLQVAEPTNSNCFKELKVATFQSCTECRARCVQRYPHKHWTFEHSVDFLIVSKCKNPGVHQKGEPLSFKSVPPKSKSNRKVSPAPHDL